MQNTGLRIRDVLLQDQRREGGGEGGGRGVGGGERGEGGGEG